MATDARFSADGTRYEEPKQRSWLQTCLMGCLIMFAVLLVIAVLAGLWVRNHWRGWASDLGAVGMKQMVASSNLPVAQQQAIADQIDRVADGFKSGRLSVEQMGKIMEQISKSPLMASIMASAADKKYIANSGLSDAEKAEGRITVRRFARGVIDHKIDREATDATMAPISEPQSNGNIRLKQIVSDEDLRAFLKAAKEQADKAGIPEQPETIDAAAEFKKIVDTAMGESGAPPLEIPPVTDIAPPPDAAK
jgi:hypothetical protein